MVRDIQLRVSLEEEKIQNILLKKSSEFLIFLKLIFQVLKFFENPLMPENLKLCLTIRFLFL